MPVKLTTTISKIPNVPNSTNSAFINDFYQYMVENDSSERNQNNYLKVIIPFAMFLGPKMKKPLSYISTFPFKYFLSIVSQTLDF